MVCLFGFPLIPNMRKVSHKEGGILVIAAVISGSNSRV